MQSPARIEDVNLKFVIFCLKKNFVNNIMSTVLKLCGVFVVITLAAVLANPMPKHESQ